MAVVLMARLWHVVVVDSACACVCPSRGVVQKKRRGVGMVDRRKELNSLFAAAFGRAVSCSICLIGLQHAVTESLSLLWCVFACQQAAGCAWVEDVLFCLCFAWATNVHAGYMLSGW